MDVDKLGLREVTYIDIISVKDEQTGVSVLKPVRKTRMEKQSQLTIDEAKTLGKEQDWTPLGEQFTTSVLTSEGRRRFVCEVDPFADERGKATPAPVVQPESEQDGAGPAEEKDKPATKRNRKVDSKKS